VAQEEKANPVAVARMELGRMESEFARALPAHIPVERFTRVVMTAIQNNPDLAIKCDRRSLWNAAMRAAQDGLLPDGRDGAIVEYKGHAQWMPMIGGIRKKVRNSGEIATWDVHAVYEKDHFEFELGDDPYIRHRPVLGDRGKIVAVYSIATLKSGEKSRDVMGIDDVEKIRKLSRAQNGPWANPTFYPEMAKKTVARRHSKVLPMSSDLDDLIRRDDNLYDLEGASDAAQKPAGRRSLESRLIAITGKGGETVDGETGEIVDKSASDAKSAKADDQPVDGTSPGDADVPDIEFGDGEIENAFQRGEDARAKGMSRKAMPADYKAPGHAALVAAWERGFNGTEE